MQATPTPAHACPMPPAAARAVHSPLLAPPPPPFAHRRPAVLFCPALGLDLGIGVLHSHQRTPGNTGELIRDGTATKRIYTDAQGSARLIADNSTGTRWIDHD